MKSLDSGVEHHLNIMNLTNGIQINSKRKIEASIEPACDFSNGHTKSYYFTKGVCDSQRHTFGRKPSHFK